MWASMVAVRSLLSAPIAMSSRARVTLIRVVPVSRGNASSMAYGSSRLRRLAISDDRRWPDLGDERSPVRVLLTRPSSASIAQRLAQRGPADTEVGGEVCFPQLAAGLGSARPESHCAAPMGERIRPREWVLNVAANAPGDGSGTVVLLRWADAEATGRQRAASRDYRLAQYASPGCPSPSPIRTGIVTRIRRLMSRVASGRRSGPAHRSLGTARRGNVDVPRSRTGSRIPVSSSLAASSRPAASRCWPGYRQLHDLGGHEVCAGHDR